MRPLVRGSSACLGRRSPWRQDRNIREGTDPRRPRKIPPSGSPCGRLLRDSSTSSHRSPWVGCKGSRRDIPLQEEHRCQASCNLGSPQVQDSLSFPLRMLWRWHQGREGRASQRRPRRKWRRSGRWSSWWCSQAPRWCWHSSVSDPSHLPSLYDLQDFNAPVTCLPSIWKTHWVDLLTEHLFTMIDKKSLRHHLLSFTFFGHWSNQSNLGRTSERWQRTSPRETSSCWWPTYMMCLILTCILLTRWFYNFWHTCCQFTFYQSTYWFNFPGTTVEDITS